MRVDGFVEGVVAHGRLNDLTAGDQSPAALSEAEQDATLRGRQKHGDAGAFRLVGVQIDAQVADHERLVGRAVEGPAQESLEARHQPQRVEGLDQVVVATKPEAGQLVDIRAHGGEDHDRRPLAGAQFREDRIPVPLRQLQVKHHKIRTPVAHRLQGVFAIARQQALRPLAREEGIDDLGNLRFVLDNQDPPIRQWCVHAPFAPRSGIWPP